jgi:type IX secretion system PorP/SprF family membrane protein
MKKILAIICFVSSTWVAIGQGVNQGVIQSTQFPVNTYMINPAYAGAEEYTSFQAAYKKNWAGLGVAPQTIYLSGFTRLQSEGKIDVKREIRKDTSDPTNYSLPTRGRSADKYKKAIAAQQDSMKILKMQDELDYQKRVSDARDELKYRPYHGVGGHIINENGPNSRTGFNATYAYHVFLSKKLRISFGGSIGLASFSTAELDFKQQEDFGNTLPSKINPDFNLGTYLYHNKFYFGLSGFTLLPGKTFDTGGSGNNLKPIFMATAGYKIAINEDLTIVPALWLRYINGVPFPVGFDVNARILYKTLWAGLTYRNSDAFSAMVGINLGKVFDLSYSYDFTTSAINQFTRAGGHEVVLGYRLQRKNGSLKSRLFN